MQNNNANGLNQLINYYQELINVNSQFNDIHDLNRQNANYKNLLNQLIVIRDLLIKRETNSINAVYKPIEKLFNNKEHFILLGTTIDYLKQNPQIDYPVPENSGNSSINNDYLPPEQEIISDYNDYNINSATNMSNSVIDEQNDKLFETLTVMQKSIKELKSNDFSFVITKSTNDMIAAFNTNYELMKSDITRYDAMLTDHINKSSAITAEAVEKEHARFAQKVAAESNAIIAGVIDATTSELAKQTDLIKSWVKEIDNKQLKHVCIVFFMNICFMFGGAILAANWTVSKIFTHAASVKSKVVK